MSFDPVTFVEDAVQIPSHEDVEGMRDFLVARIEDNGIDTRVDEAGNVIASRGSGEPRLVLNTHIDTVPPHVPFERDGEVIRGRGSCDAKGPLAALLAGFVGVDPQEGRVTLAVTPDEETRSTGAAALDLPADAVIVGEPTGLDVCTAARGRFEGEIVVRGENAHAAEPASGENAIAGAARVLLALETFDDREGAPPVHPDLGGPTLTPTIIDGGETANQVPDECRIVVDRRSVPPETADGFRDALSTHLRAAVPEAETEVRLADRATPYLEAFETPADSRLVETLRDAAGRGVRPFTAATEASYFAADAPTVVFGPGVLADDEGAVAHSDREYVRVPEVEAAAAAVTRTVGSFVS